MLHVFFDFRRTRGVLYVKNPQKRAATPVDFYTAYTKGNLTRSRARPTIRNSLSGSMGLALYVHLRARARVHFAA